MGKMTVVLEVEFPKDVLDNDPSVQYVRNYIASTMNAMLSDLNFNIQSTLVVQDKYEE